MARDRHRYDNPALRLRRADDYERDIAGDGAAVRNGDFHRRLQLVQRNGDLDGHRDGHISGREHHSDNDLHDYGSKSPAPSGMSTGLQDVRSASCRPRGSTVASSIDPGSEQTNPGAGRT